MPLAVVMALVNAMFFYVCYDSETQTDTLPAAKGLPRKGLYGDGVFHALCVMFLFLQR